MDNQWREFEQSMSGEVGKELAQEFVRNIFHASHGSVMEAERLYVNIGTLWYPAICHWGNWVKEKAQFPPILVLRDAKPLTVFAPKEEWPRVWLNRLIFGIMDELSESQSYALHPLAKEYLDQEELRYDFTFVDSGCWGTIVQKLHSNRIGLRFQPLFFFSHNPYISGFVNDLGFSEKEGEILNDSLECCFPNTTTRPSEFIEKSDGQIVPVLKPMDELSVILGSAVFKGLHIGKIAGHIVSAEESIVRLLEASYRTQKTGEFTGMLPGSSPTWSFGKEFLSTWPKDLSWA